MAGEGLPLVHGDIMDQSWRETRDLAPTSSALSASQWTSLDEVTVSVASPQVQFYGGPVPSIRFLVPKASPTRPVGTRTPMLARLGVRPEWRHPNGSSRFRVSPGLRYEISATALYSGEYSPVSQGLSQRLIIQFWDESGAYIASREAVQAPTPVYQEQSPSVIYLAGEAPERAVEAGVFWTADFSSGNPDVELFNLAFHLVDPKIELFGDASGVTEVGVATTTREGLVSDVFARSRERIEVQLAQPDEQLIAGERIELAAFAATSTEVSWTWRQVTGPTVEIERKGNAAHFIAPDVNTPTDLRVACRAASTDGANQSNWHFFDLTIQPPRTRWIPGEGSTFTPRSPQMVGYDRGKREIWNDVTLPNGMDPSGRWESVLRDLGIPADDVQFVTDGEPPARAAAGGVYIDMETHDIYRNFGGGYNESDDTEGAPRRNAYMVNPATGDIFEWREGES